MKSLKDTYANPGLFKQLAIDLKSVYPRLDEIAFRRAALKGLDDLELKARIMRAADCCHEFLPASYLQSLDVLRCYVKGRSNHFFHIFLSMYVMKYGLSHYEESMRALRDFTQYSSSEEGVRPFIQQNLKRSVELMVEWAGSENEHIRRLASEGSRPRLPWASQIAEFKTNPQLAWPILDKLKTDSHKYVQKSVANHLNDISKDHPEWLINQLSTWDLSHPVTLWIVRHGLRTLIKQGHPDALRLLGFEQANVVIENVSYSKQIKFGEKFRFNVQLKSAAVHSQKLNVDYGIYFVKQRGDRRLKVFKLKKVDLLPKSVVAINGMYEFKNLSTRKHYMGEHVLQLFINGQPSENFPFTVKT